MTIPGTPICNLNISNKNKIIAKYVLRLLYAGTKRPPSTPYDHDDMSKNLHLSAAAYNALSATSMKLLFIDNRKDVSARWLYFVVVCE